MRGHLKRYVLVFGFALLFPVVTLAGAKFQKIKETGCVNTLPSGINNAGWIVGTCAHEQSVNDTEEGFLLRDGAYTQISPPQNISSLGVFDSDLGGVNDNGVIVGTWGDNKSHPNLSKDHCFLRDKDGHYKSFDVPYDTVGFPDCNGINNGGDTVGIYTDSNGNHGWLRKGSMISKLDVSGAGFSGAFYTEAYGINKDGDIVGSYQDAASHTRGFLLHNGQYRKIDFPGLSTPNTDAYGINDEGDIVGSYTDSSATDHGFVRRDDEYTTVDVPVSDIPDAYETNKVTGINNRGCMVGVYTSGGVNGPEYGFKAGLREADGDGEEAGRYGGRAYMHVHEDDCIEQPDREDYRDPSARAHSVTIAGLGTNIGVDFHSTQNTAVTYDNVAHSVTIAGLGTNNGVPVAFTIIAVDSSLVPPGIFSITLSDGYSNTGSLLAGAITIH
jgi:probable HAF family extracellular repeat protein